MRRKHEMRPCQHCGEPVCNANICPSCEDKTNPVWEKLKPLSGSLKAKQRTHNSSQAGSTPAPTTIPILKHVPPFTWIDATANLPRVGKHVLVAYLTSARSGYCRQIIIAIRGDDGWHFIDSRHRSKKPSKIKYWMIMAPPRARGLVDGHRTSNSADASLTLAGRAITTATQPHQQ